jgi:hypothetical protein
VGLAIVFLVQLLARFLCLHKEVMYSVNDVALQGEHLLGLVLLQPSDLAGQATDLSASSVGRL